MAKALNRTRVSAALGVEYPIVQGPLGGLTSQKLAAGVSNFVVLDHLVHIALSLPPSRKESPRFGR
jgi:NAD(P)H-dependent flavin oxidoreductase YrpB (nitropropane dioxygenase family)